jgi:hypothetical protein
MLQGKALGQAGAWRTIIFWRTEFNQEFRRCSENGILQPVLASREGNPQFMACAHFGFSLSASE